jgi:ankyrin repeat protein
MRPIHWAASEGKIGVLSYLISAGVNANPQDSNGCTPLVIAAQHDKLNCLVFLIKNGADVSITDANGDNALHWAAYKGYLDVTGALAYLMPNYLEVADRYGQVSIGFPYLVLSRCISDTISLVVVVADAPSPGDPSWQ